eukprot:TRINITY_DN11309_c0_g1_i3.p1 TRINITY_DN11309_c0_g1~~TRINITY_DN11309_c0_g1_i3.p1  ORF type:complete len:135 (-),score=19.40 TRINITY_DN11309_c0_g1_i3:132-536(-)
MMIRSLQPRDGAMRTSASQLRMTKIDLMDNLSSNESSIVRRKSGRGASAQRQRLINVVQNSKSASKLFPYGHRPYERGSEFADNDFLNHFQFKPKEREKSIVTQFKHLYVLRTEVNPQSLKPFMVKCRYVSQDS